MKFTKTVLGFSGVLLLLIGFLFFFPHYNDWLMKKKYERQDRIENSFKPTGLPGRVVRVIGLAHARQNLDALVPQGVTTKGGPERWDFVVFGKHTPLDLTAAFTHCDYEVSGTIEDGVNWTAVSVIRNPGAGFASPKVYCIPPPHEVLVQTVGVVSEKTWTPLMEKAMKELRAGPEPSRVAVRAVLGPAPFERIHGSLVRTSSTTCILCANWTLQGITDIYEFRRGNRHWLAEVSYDKNGILQGIATKGRS